MKTDYDFSKGKRGLIAFATQTRGVRPASPLGHVRAVQGSMKTASNFYLG